MSNQHILVVIKARGCPGCEALTRIWPNIQREMARRKISLREKFITRELRGHLPPGVYPPLLDKMGWAPAILLINGQQWNRAMAKVGESSAPSISNFVIFSGRMNKDRPELIKNFEYNFTQPKSFVDWLEKALTQLDLPAASFDTKLKSKNQTYNLSKGNSQKSAKKSSCKGNVCNLRIIPRK